GTSRQDQHGFSEQNTVQHHFPPGTVGRLLRWKCRGAAQWLCQLCQLPQWLFHLSQWLPQLQKPTNDSAWSPCDFGSASCLRSSSTRSASDGCAETVVARAAGAFSVAAATTRPPTVAFRSSSRRRLVRDRDWFSLFDMTVLLPPMLGLVSREMHGAGRGQGALVNLR